MDAKCKCQNCDGKVSFPADMAGQTITCPHCQLPTILFIPPPAPVPKKRMSWKMKIIMTASALFIITCLLVAAVTFTIWHRMVFAQPSQDKQPVKVFDKNLKPVSGAFGYTLGAQGHAVSTETIEDKSMLPFDNISVDVIPDGRICSISAMGGVRQYESDDVKKRLIAVLTDKYGLRTTGGGLGESYEFGTRDRSARLWIIHSKDDSDDLFNIDYSDRELNEIYYKKMEAGEKTEDATKKAALSKGL